MSKTEALKVLNLLAAYYGQGKVPTRDMADAWYMQLRQYEYVVAVVAVKEYAEHDTREYASFPTVGAIVAAIKRERSAITGARNKALHRRKYDDLTDRQKAWCPRATYEYMCTLSERELIEGFDDLRAKIWGKHRQKLLKGD